MQLFKKWATPAAAWVALVLSGCQSVAGRIGLYSVPPVRDACVGIEAPLDVKATGKRVACEVYAGISEYEGVAEAAKTVQAEALKGDDRQLKQFAVELGRADARVSPIAQGLNRALYEFVYLDGVAAEVNASTDKTATALSKAAEAYARLRADWHDAQPILDDFRTAWGKDKAPDGDAAK